MRLSGSRSVNGELVKEARVVVQLFLDLFEIS